MKFKLDPLPWRSEFQDDPFTYQIKLRLREKRNTMVAFISDPRAGKSNAEKVLGEQININRPFKARDITFLPTDYLEAITKAEPGDYRPFDEPGAEWSSRRFMSIKNQMMNATHVTFGSKYINVGWAIPVLTMQDLQARMLIKYVFYMNSTGPKGMARLYQNWVNHYTGKTGRTKLGGCWFAPCFQDRPEEEKEYDEMKKNYQDQSYEKYYKEFSKADDPYKAKVEENMEKLQTALKKVLESPSQYLNSKGRVDANSLRLEFGTTVRDSEVIARQANKKLASLQTPTT